MYISQDRIRLLGDENVEYGTPAIAIAVDDHAKTAASSAGRQEYIDAQAASIDESDRMLTKQINYKKVFSSRNYTENAKQKTGGFCFYHIKIANYLHFDIIDLHYIKDSFFR